MGSYICYLIFSTNFLKTFSATAPFLRYFTINFNPNPTVTFFKKESVGFVRPDSNRASADCATPIRPANCFCVSLFSIRARISALNMTNSNSSSSCAFLNAGSRIISTLNCLCVIIFIKTSITYMLS